MHRTAFFIDHVNKYNLDIIKEVANKYSVLKKGLKRVGGDPGSPGDDMAAHGSILGSAGGPTGKGLAGGPTEFHGVTVPSRAG